MNNKFLIGILIAGLAVAFAAVSILVIISRRNPLLIKRKLQLGALLISLSGITAGCKETVTCYEPAIPNVVTIDQYDSERDEVSLSRSGSGILTGKVSQRTSDKFSFTISDPAGAQLQLDDATASDGAFDEESEDFRLAINKTLPAGIYELRIFAAPKDSVKNYNYFTRHYKLKLEE